MSLLCHSALSFGSTLISYTHKLLLGGYSCGRLISFVDDTAFVQSESATGRGCAQDKIVVLVLSNNI